MKIVVLKFGGTSVGSVSRIKNVIKMYNGSYKKSNKDGNSYTTLL